MAFLIIAHDHEGMEEKREKVRNSHREYLEKYGKKLLSSGAILDENNSKIIGGASLIDTNSRHEAVRFEAEDPYALAGIRAKVEIHHWRIRWWLGNFNINLHTPSKDI